MENDVIDSGLNSLISYTLNSDLPHSAIIKELDENIKKYRNDSTLTDIDIIRVATRISTKELLNIEDLNNLAKTDNQRFIATIKEESEKQEKEERERVQRFESFLNQLERMSKLAVKPADLEKEKLKRLNALNEIRQFKRNEFIDNVIAKWRRRTWRLFGITLFAIFIIIWIICKVPTIKDVNKIFTLITIIIGSVVEFFISKCLYSKYYDNTNINAYKSQITIPNDLKELTDITQLPD